MNEDNLLKKNSSNELPSQTSENEFISDTEITEGLLSLSNFRSSFSETQNSSDFNSTSSDNFPRSSAQTRDFQDPTEEKINSSLFQSIIRLKKVKKSNKKNISKSKPHYMNNLTDFDLNNFNESLKIQFQNGDLYVPIFRTYHDNLVPMNSSFQSKTNTQNKKKMIHGNKSTKKKFDFEKYRQEVLKSYSLSDDLSTQISNSSQLNNSSRFINHQALKKKSDYQKYLAHISEDNVSFP